MGIPVNVGDLINGKVIESTRIEFKSGFNPNAVIHTICAFANDIDNIGGGYVVLGVEEHNGSPIFPLKGIPKEEIDGILKKLLGFCHRIEPLYNPVVEPIEHDGVYLIVIWAPGGHGRPYKAAKDVFTASSQKLHYIRKFSSTVVASPDEEKQLFYVSTDIPFDDRPNFSAQVGDLDLGLMREYLATVGSGLHRLSEGMDTLELAQNMQLVAGPPEDLHPLNVAVLMFCENPQRFFRYARIEVVEIPDPTGTNMVEAVFTGPIHRQLRDALAYIENRVVRELITKDPGKTRSDRVFNYPMRAVQELLANAVYHRSYQVPEPITVRIEPSGIEITSFPGFDRSISDEAIAQRKIRARSYRNRRIGDFLKELRYIEGRNTGFPNAFRSLMANGSQDLEFVSDEQRGFLSVTIPVHPAFLPKENGKALAYEEQILTTLGSGELTLTELAHAMGYRGISKKLSSFVEILVQKGVLERVITSGGSKTKLRAR